MFHRLVLALLLAAPAFFAPSRAGAQTYSVSDSAALVHGPKLSPIGPNRVDAGTTLVVVVQTAPQVVARLHVRFEGQINRQRRRTGKHGRAVFAYAVPLTVRDGKVRLTADAVLHGHRLSVTKHVVVRPFVPTVGIAGVQVLQSAAAGWVPATQVRLGEAVRFVATYGVTEPAGDFFPPCVSGSLRILKDGATLVTAPVQCPPTQPSNGLP